MIRFGRCWRLRGWPWPAPHSGGSLDVIFGPTVTAFVGLIASAVALSFRYERAPALTAAYFARFKAQ